MTETSHAVAASGAQEKSFAGTELAERDATRPWLRIPMPPSLAEDDPSSIKRGGTDPVPHRTLLEPAPPAITAVEQATIDKLGYAILLAHLELDSPVPVVLRALHDARYRKALQSIFLTADVTVGQILAYVEAWIDSIRNYPMTSLVPEGLETLIPTAEVLTSVQQSDKTDTEALMALRDELQTIPARDAVIVSRDVALRGRALLGDRIVETLFIIALTAVEVGVVGYQHLRVTSDPMEPPSSTWFATAYGNAWRDSDQALAGPLLGAIVKFIMIMDATPLSSTTVELTRQAGAALGEVLRLASELSVWGSDSRVTPFALHEVSRMLQEWSLDNWYFKASAYWDALPADTRVEIAIQAHTRDTQTVFGPTAILDNQNTLRSRMRAQNVIWGNDELLSRFVKKSGLSEIRQGPTLTALHPCSMIRGLRLCANKLASTAKALLPQCIRPEELADLLGPVGQGAMLYQFLHATATATTTTGDVATHAHPLAKLRFLPTKLKWPSAEAEATAIKQIEQAVEPICTAERQHLLRVMTGETGAAEYQNRVMRAVNTVQSMLAQGRLIPSVAEEADIAHVSRDVAERTARDIKGVLNGAPMDSGSNAPVLFAASAGYKEDLEHTMESRLLAIQKYRRELQETNDILAALGPEDPARATVLEKRRAAEDNLAAYEKDAESTRQELAALRERQATADKFVVAKQPIPTTLADPLRIREEAIRELAEYELENVGPTPDGAESTWLTRILLLPDPEWRNVLLDDVERALNEAQALSEIARDDSRWMLYTIHGIARARAILRYKYLLQAGDSPAAARRLRTLTMDAHLMFYDVLFGIALHPNLVSVFARGRILHQFDNTWLERALLYSPYIRTIMSIVLYGFGMQMRDIVSSSLRDYMTPNPSLLLSGIQTADGAPLDPAQLPSIMDKLLAILSKGEQNSVDLMLSNNTPTIITLQFKDKVLDRIQPGPGLRLSNSAAVTASLRSLQESMTKWPRLASLVKLMQDLTNVNTDVAQAPGFVLSWLATSVGARKPFDLSKLRFSGRLANVVQVGAVVAEVAKLHPRNTARTLASDRLQPLPASAAAATVPRADALTRFKDLIGAGAEAGDAHDPWTDARSRAAFLDATVLPIHAVFYKPPQPLQGASKVRAVAGTAVTILGYVAFTLVVQNLVFNTVADSVAHAIQTVAVPQNKSLLTTIYEYGATFTREAASGQALGTTGADIPSVFLQVVWAGVAFAYSYFMYAAFTKTVRVVRNSVGAPPKLTAAVADGAIEIAQSIIDPDGEFQVLPIGGTGEPAHVMWFASKPLYRLARARLQYNPIPSTAFAALRMISGKFVSYETADANDVPYGAHAQYGLEVFRDGTRGTYARFPGMVEGDTYKLIFNDPATRANIALSLDLATADIEPRIMFDAARVLVKTLVTDVWYVLTNRAEMTRVALPDNLVRYDGPWQGIFNLVRMLNAIAGIPDPRDETKQLEQQLAEFSRLFV